MDRLSSLINLSSVKIRQKIWAHILINEKLTDDMYSVHCANMLIHLEKLKPTTINCIKLFLMEDFSDFKNPKRKPNKNNSYNTNSY